VITEVGQTETRISVAAGVSFRGSNGGRAKTEHKAKRTEKLAYERRESGFRYYYTCTRRNGRNEKTYFGRGFAAEIAVELEAQKRERRRAEAEALKAEQARLEPLDRKLAELEHATDLMLAITLTAAGFHRQNYCRWRKKRVRSTPKNGRTTTAARQAQSIAEARPER
jgi:hypothetical protein